MTEAGGAYTETILDHFLNPRNVGDLPDADGVGEVGATAFGDVMRISLKIQDGRIKEARFKTFGCGAAIATSSIATELITGRSVEDALKFSSQEISQALGGLPAAKSHCGVMAEEAVKAALEDYLSRHTEALTKLQTAPDNAGG
jgi:nitrogen fixation protein NifU and related proteins